MSPIIEVNNLSKQYRLGKVGTGSLAHDLNRWWHRLRGREDPYLRIGEVNDRATKAQSDYVWALRDINFSVQPGEVLGIIGRNGAGKSTLLKILSRITMPTTGSITLRGRVASLLEVGTGMHPELTGRENIYLNGAILGMRRREIDRKLDAIVDFAGVERYLDTPVKRYSSGMHVRLGFAVAAHLEPDILIVDEVLAVGDAEFQKKCLGKMQDVSRQEGRTVLFVSHNMAAVKSLCPQAILLITGGIEDKGSSEYVINKYLNQFGEGNQLKDLAIEKDGLWLKRLGIRNKGFDFDAPIHRDLPIEIDFQYINNTGMGNMFINVRMKDDLGNYFLVTSSGAVRHYLKQGEAGSCLNIPPAFFNEGSYTFDVLVIYYGDAGPNTLIQELDALRFNVLPEKREMGSWMGKSVGSIRTSFEWS